MRKTPRAQEDIDQEARARQFRAELEREGRLRKRAIAVKTEPTFPEPGPDYQQSVSVPTIKANVSTSVRPKSFFPSVTSRHYVSNRKATARAKSPPSLSGNSSAERQSREEYVRQLWKLASDGIARRADFQQVASATGRSSGRVTMHINTLERLGYLHTDYRTGTYRLNELKKPWDDDS